MGVFEGVLRSVAVLALAAATSACGRQDAPAIEGADPLHAHGIRLPPLASPLPPRPARDEARTVLHVAPPPLSPGIFPCSQCHDGSAPAADLGPAIPHATHLAMDFACTDCHASDAGPDEPRVPDPELCMSCHDPADDLPGVEAYFTAITGADGRPVLPRRWRTRDVKANHAGHAALGVACATCHGEPSDGPFVKPKPLDLMRDCTQCHEDQAAPTACASCHAEVRDRRHADIVLRHSDDQRGCFTCHDPDDRDTLRLADGTRVRFEESYRLCGQCHGPQLRDWREGLHGKRTGMWDGETTYLLCVHCHSDPHQPRFPPMTPLPPPVRPEDIR